MRLFVSTVVVLASLSASAGVVIECRNTRVDEATTVTVERHTSVAGKRVGFYSLMTVEEKNLNTDQVATVHKNVANEGVRGQNKLVTSGEYTLEFSLIGENIYTQDGTVITVSEGTLTKVLSSGATQVLPVHCSAFDRW